VVPVAYYYAKGNGYLVRWRDGGRRTPLRSRFVRTEAEAQLLKAELDKQALGRRVLSSVPGIPGWDDDLGPVSAVDAGYAFADYLRGVIERDKALRPSSRDTYGHSIRNHIAGTPLGRGDVRAITSEDVRDYWSGLNLGPGALRNVRQLLSKGFNAAIREGVRDDNPMTRAAIRAPAKDRQVEIVPLTTAELERLAGATLQPRDRLIVLVLAYGGLRAGEVGGLRVQDIDFERCQLKLRQQVIYARGQGPVVAPLKTRAARRTITIPCSVAEELRAFAKESPPTADGRVFHGTGGAPLAHVAINHVVQRAATRAGLRPVHAHLLRHTAVSWLIEDGANPKAIQAFVGHSDIKMTLGVYGHLFDYGGQALADSMERRRQQSRNGLS
jgi:integrase